MDRKLQRLKPAVGKQTLVLLSGVLWVLVGLMLLNYARQWLMAQGGAAAVALGLSGLGVSLFIHHFGFLRVVDKNLGRILPMQGKRCVFAFQSWKSYLIVVIMIAMGVGLRHSPIPKPYLSVLYIGIGLALILSSFRYLKYYRELSD